MSNINELVFFENKKENDDKDLPTKGHVGAGYGKVVGAHVGGPVGYGLGYYIGKHHLMKHPNQKMDKHSAIDRTGAMLDNSSKLKNIGIKIAGAAVGAALGHHVGGRTTSNPLHKHERSIGGSAIGAVIGSQLAHHLLGAGRDNRKLAKKIGYGHLGRVSASLTPLTGIFKPHDQREDD